MPRTRWVPAIRSRSSSNDGAVRSARRSARTNLRCKKPDLAGRASKRRSDWAGNALRRLVLERDFFAFRGLAAARALGKRGFDLLHGLGLGDALHRRDFAREPIERRFVELPLAVGLLGLSSGPE